MTTEPRDLEPIRRHDDLVEPFASACKPRAAFKVGPEMEKFGLLEPARSPMPYSGERGVLRVLAGVAERFGWSPEREHEAGPIVALKRRGASITLEPGAQLELSGAQSDSIHEVCAEGRLHMSELGPLSRELGITWLGLGFHPLAARADFEWVPKQRYGIMREYLPRRGAHALDMMLRTCTVQVNLDYESEADAMRKLRTALALAPVTTAMFANSPWLEGKPHGGVTYRGRVWLDVDPDRTGLLPSLWKAGATFGDYVEWALDAPMFLFKRQGKVVANTGQTFRSFLADGFEGHRATLGDWKLHLNTLFPEVRLKNTIELRAADMQSTDMACALPALWTGVLYDDRALAEAEAFVADWTHAEVSELRNTAWIDGLRAHFRDRPLAHVAERLLTIAEGGLERRGRLSAKGNDERVHLARLKGLVESGRCPADVLLEGMDREEDTAAAIVRRGALRWG